MRIFVCSAILGVAIAAFIGISIAGLAVWTRIQGSAHGVSRAEFCNRALLEYTNTALGAIHKNGVNAPGIENAGVAYLKTSCPTGGLLAAMQSVRDAAQNPMVVYGELK